MPSKYCELVLCLVLLSNICTWLGLGEGTLYQQRKKYIIVIIFKTCWHSIKYTQNSDHLFTAYLRLVLRTHGQTWRKSLVKTRLLVNVKTLANYILYY